MDSARAVQVTVATPGPVRAPVPARSPSEAPDSAPPLAPDLQAAADSSATSLPSAAEAAKDPAAAFRRYLAYETFRGAPSFGGAGLSYCPPIVLGENDVDEGWEPDNYMGFVRPRLLEASLSKGDTTGKTATALVELMRVMRIGRDTVDWVGTLEQRLDTLEFTGQIGPDGWAVCGPAMKYGADGKAIDMVFTLTYSDAIRTEVNGAHWRPAGTTWLGVAAHADSVLRIRR